MSKIRVILADDHPLTRQGLKAYLEREENVALVGEAADGDEAWKLIEELKPDVALLDIRMPGADGITLARRIKENKLPVAAIMLTSYDSQQYVLASLKAGAKGFVLKTTSAGALMKAIQTVATGSLFLDSEVASVVGAQEELTEALSPREREVLLCAARGLSSKEVAAQLYISERTVQTHLASVYDKLGAHNKTEAMLLALKHGLMTLEELLD
ncbi:MULTISPECIES: response regulator transcription factor [Jonquetella]|uniref:Response regulator containing a CheY-like receiver domain and an HTH DNA-binding domain n=1 Tax=Jonquetella anthropi DSM 22815 TaxID=885272 RepID=H0ULS3_9BACT|nr:MULTISPECIES: response regulator transcription factor [Jonquetella]EEX48129.1 response regulator receiver domain protein [Jonquetella anthropi E3_33 E1]EHM13564.1 response regulator containing a CheY-like receiver domain and an HTH DNA-binding domain [Jonquetella anthropi DSM 22815]ERL24375.1 response regulator receiver domain protein [Jonquetella sp. BV3C21]